MYFLYIDESGSNTSHFVLSGIAIPALSWKEKTTKFSSIKAKYDLTGKEIHTGWMMRRYLEQERIKDFEKLSKSQRIQAVKTERKATLLYIAANSPQKKLKLTKKNFKKTNDYIHLTLDERKNCLYEIADLINTWQDCRLFAEAIDLKRYDLSKTAYESAFENVISRFDTFLELFSKPANYDYHGLVIQDNNGTVAKHLTDIMKEFHTSGTIWNKTTRIIETPLFVDSALTGMVQIADLCSYTVRRFFENDEKDLFNRIYPRFDRLRNTVVGLRHYTGQFYCRCRVCCDHRVC